jgi:hypothetical protein
MLQVARKFNFQLQISGCKARNVVRSQFVKGLPVITMAEGKHIGKIDDMVIDPERKMVAWFPRRAGAVPQAARRPRGPSAMSDATGS